VFCVIAIIGGIICVIAAFAIFNMDSQEQENEEARSSFQYFSALDPKESASKS